MLLHIPGVVDANQLGIIRSALKQASFVDGKLTAGQVAKDVKHNQELEQSSDIAQQLAQVMVGNLYANTAFKDAALPHRIAQPIFARYEPGMTYGAHIDDPVMGADNQRFRCDVAVTLFLNDPDEYEGGELTVVTAFGEQRFKFPAGDIVLYPASSVHYVDEIKTGERLVGVAWIQSMVRDPARREILYELSQARNNLLEAINEDPNAKHIDHAYVNLVRMWAEV